jgi:hypothetical protein
LTALTGAPSAQGINQLTKLPLHPLQLLALAREPSRSLGLQPVPFCGESRGEILEQHRVHQALAQRP